uniref:Sperm flagellar 1 n=1 Tax=Malurus cyaneus samueli TaxID=2593467 RepID=A0A8C5TDQ2_9PASS
MAAAGPDTGPATGAATGADTGPDRGPDTSLVSLYRWLDTVPLSRPRRNIARDFSDGVLAAEVVKFFLPSMVELHSFVPTSSTAQKVANWGHLNRKVLSKLNLLVPEAMIQQLVQSRPGMAEQLLQLLRDKIQERQRLRRAGAGQVRGTGDGESRGQADGEGRQDPQGMDPLGKGRAWAWDRGKEFLPGRVGGAGLELPDSPDPWMSQTGLEPPRAVTGGCPPYFPEFFLPLRRTASGCRQRGEKGAIPGHRLRSGGKKKSKNPKIPRCGLSGCPSRKELSGAGDPSLGLSAHLQCPGMCGEGLQPGGRREVRDGRGRTSLGSGGFMGSLWVWEVPHWGLGGSPVEVLGRA